MTDTEHSTSFNECIKMAIDPERSSYADRDWSNAVEWSAEEIFDRFLGGERSLSVCDRPHHIQKIVHLKFEPAMMPEYFTSQSLAHDGTWLFIDEMFERICERVCVGDTQMVGKEMPDQCNVYYTIGNFIMLNEYDDEAFATPKKPWLLSRTTVILPLSYAIEVSHDSVNRT